MSLADRRPCIRKSYYVYVCISVALDVSHADRTQAYEEFNMCIFEFQWS